jgi:hypothetical protein
MNVFDAEQFGDETAGMARSLMCGSFAPAFEQCIALTHSATSDFGQHQPAEIRAREAFVGSDPTEVPFAATQTIGVAAAKPSEVEDVFDGAVDQMLVVMADRGVELLS